MHKKKSAIIFNGPLNEKYDILSLIDAFLKIKNKRKDLEFQIIANDSFNNSELTKKIQLISQQNDNIFLHLKLENNQVENMLKKASAGIICTSNSKISQSAKSIFQKYQHFNLNIITNILDFKNKHLKTIFFEKNLEKVLLLYHKKDLINKKNFDILYLANHTEVENISGYTIRTKHILSELGKHKKVICFSKPKITLKNLISKKRIEVFFMEENIYYLTNQYLNYKKNIIEFINNSSIKIVWSASNYVNGSLSGKIGKKINNISSIYEIRGLWHYSRKYKELVQKGKYNKLLFKMYDRKEKKASLLNNYIFCENKSILKLCQQDYNVDLKKLFVLPNGVKQIPELKDKDLKTKQKKVFGYIGSICSYEGLENLISTFQKIDNTKYDYQLLIIGGGKNLDNKITIEKIKNLIAKDKNKRIKYLGQIPFDQVEKYYKMIDIICLPRVDCDVTNLVTPLKPFEAIGYGKVILCSSVDPMLEIMTHNQTAIIFDKKNIQDLYNKIIDILNNKYDLNSIRKQAYQHIQNHTWKDSYENVKKIIDNICAQHNLSVTNK